MLSDFKKPLKYLKDCEVDKLPNLPIPKKKTLNNVSEINSNKLSSRAES